jgi:putative spermidine/putrescine transport system ATP-binding protein
MASVLHIGHVGKTYGATTALDDINLSIAADQYVSLLGPSGSGKTTLLRLIAGFEPPDRGDIVFAGRRVNDIPAHRRGIGFVFQNFALFPHMTVWDNIAFGPLNGTGSAMNRNAAASRVRDMIQLVGLGGLEDRGVNQISGGQRQRVALARTLITEPRLVLLDEPLGALDANLRERMRGELRGIRERLGVTFLHVTGSESEALAMGDTIIVLDAGRIAQVGAPDAVFQRPATPNVARFLNHYNLFDGAVDGETFAGSAGRFPVDGAIRLDGGRGATPAYAIPYDRITVEDAEAAGEAGRTGVAGRFVASEYTGATVISFFALDNGGLVEVEAHLSHRTPPHYADKARYRLCWKPQDAILFT